MQQQNWGTVAAVAQIDRCLSDMDLIRLEAFEHTPSLPVLSIGAGARSRLLEQGNRWLMRH